MKLFEISNPAAVGWEWVTESGVTHQISWTRGTNQLHYGSRGRGRANWTNTLIVAPERFGFDGTLEGARKAAQRFYDESEVKA
jgi:hypothetical protein